ncbi:MAG TPA: hypothetical protein DHV65_03990 [Ktedonobacter sp.]|nr:hypothetical protein [Ktedonobacter sp.]
MGNIIGGMLPEWFHSISWLMAPLPPWLRLLLANQPDPRSYQLSLLFAGAIALPSLIPLFMLKEKRHPTLPNSGLTLPRFDTNLLLSIRSIVVSPIFFLILVQVMIGAGAGLFIPYFNIYFVQGLKAPPALFGLLSGGATAVTALLTLTAPWLARRVGKVNSVVVTHVSSIPLLVMIGLIPLLPIAATLYIFRQGLMDMSSGVLQVYSMEAVAEQYRGVANSGYQAAFLVPWALMAPIGGVIITHFGYPAVFIGGALSYLLASLILWGKFSRGRKKEFEHVGESDSDIGHRTAGGKPEMPTSDMLHS